MKKSKFFMKFIKTSNAYKNIICIRPMKAVRKTKLFKMNKAELIEAIAKENGLTKSKSGEVVATIVNAITDALKSGEKVSLVGFGTWTITKREERRGRNPKTGEEITIASKTVAKFKPGNDLTKSIN